MTARFIFSLDCEGKWGIADADPQDMAFITSAGLNRAYQGILELLDEFKCPATFAFVAGLCLEAEEFAPMARQPLWHNDLDWLAVMQQSVRAGDMQGWHEPQLLSQVQARGYHHICSHSGTHIPYDESLTESKSIARDIEIIRHFHAKYGLKPDTFVYPKNVMGFQGLLYEAGFQAYRTCDADEARAGLSGKVRRLLNDFLMLNGTTSWPVPGERVKGPLLELSAGKFLTTRMGRRKYLPVSMTVRRFERLLEKAVSTGSVLHVYTHPHDFITDISMYDKLRHLLRAVRQYADRGELAILTMKQELAAACQS